MNAPTFIIAAMIAAAVCAIIVKGIRNRKEGKTGCSCGCDGCAGASTCHPTKDGR